MTESCSAQGELLTSRAEGDVIASLPGQRRSALRGHIIGAVTLRSVCNEHGAAVVVWGGEDGGIEQNTLAPLPVACDPTTVIGVLVCSDGSERMMQPGAFGEVVRLCVVHDEPVLDGAKLYEFEERSPTVGEWRRLHETVEELTAQLHVAQQEKSAFISWRTRREQRKEWVRRRAEAQRELHERAKSYPGGVAEFNFAEGQKRVAGDARFDADRDRWLRDQQRKRERARRAEQVEAAHVEMLRARRLQRDDDPSGFHSADKP